MKTIVNKEELRREWLLEKWYEKTYYVFGLITTWIWLLAFVVAFIDELD